MDWESEGYSLITQRDRLHTFGFTKGETSTETLSTFAPWVMGPRVESNKLRRCQYATIDQSRVASSPIVAREESLPHTAEDRTMRCEFDVMAQVHALEFR